MVTPGASQALVWGATLAVTVVSKIRAAPRWRFVEVRVGNGEGSSLGLCISRHGGTEHWHLQAGMGQSGNGSSPCIRLGQKRSFNAIGDYSFLCFWAGEELGLAGSWAPSTGGKVATSVGKGEGCRGPSAAQRAWAPGRQGQGGHGSIRTGPQVAIIIHRPCFCFQQWTPKFSGNFKPIEFVASNFFDLQFRVSLAIFLKS